MQNQKKTGDANKIVHTHQVKAFNCLHIRLAVSWGNSFFDAWEKVYKDCSTLTKSILERVFKQGKPQQWWLKGVPAVVLANTMVCLQIINKLETN